MGARVATLLLVFQLPLLAAAQTDRPPEWAAPEAGLNERLSVRRVHRPVLITEKGRGSETGDTVCSNLAPDQIEVLEDDVAAVVTAVGPRPLPRIHALLIDISYSMRDDLVEAKRAAIAYVDSLPANDAVLMAAFDESMVLGSPVTTDRDAIREAVDDLSIGQYTSLWDSLHEVVRYLSTMHGEKVIVLVSDGEDTTSLDPDVFENLIDEITVTPDTVIFPIGLGLSANPRIDGMPTWLRLNQVSERTGGEFFKIQSVAGLSKVLDRIQRRLDSRIYVSYIPKPFGKGPQDRPDYASSRWRRVRVKARDGLPCKIEALGYSQRFEGRRYGAESPVEIVGLSEDEPEILAAAIASSCGTPPPKLEIAEKLRFIPSITGAQGLQSPSHLYTVASHEQLIGNTTDVIVERGPLFKRKRYWNGGKYRTQVDRKPLFEPRVFVVETPPLRSVRTELTGPEDLLIYLLERDICAPPPSEGQPYARSPIFVHGRTFLEMRDFLGRVLYRAYPDYRDWAAGRVEETIDSDLNDLLKDLPASMELTDESVAALRQALLARETDPDEGHSHLYLAEWLGDVSALKTIRSLERDLINRMLSGDDPGEVERLAKLVAGSWEKLTLWFAPATTVRILTPLVPAYDPERDTIGFYRFVLARPNIDGEPDEILHDRPLGLLAMRWILDQPELAEMLRRRTEVISLESDVVNRRETRGLDCRLGTPIENASGNRRHRPSEKVVIELGAVGAKDQWLSLNAYFLTSGEDGGEYGVDLPACFSVTGAADGSVWSEIIANELTNAIDRTNLSAARSDR
jgi:hypothetical protein